MLHPSKDIWVFYVYGVAYADLVVYLHAPINLKFVFGCIVKFERNIDE